MYKVTQLRKKWLLSQQGWTVSYLNKQTYLKKKISSNRESVSKESIQKESHRGKHWQRLLKHSPRERELLDVSPSSPDGVKSHPCMGMDA
jgi:hypothetical protein